MKNTLKSKTFWSTLGCVLLFQLIALEPFLPQINQYLPAEYAFIGSIVLPSLIIIAKLIRDKGFLTKFLESKGYVVSAPDHQESNNEANIILKETIKTSVKKVSNKKVVKK